MFFIMLKVKLLVRMIRIVLGMLVVMFSVSRLM